MRAAWAGALAAAVLSAGCVLFTPVKTATAIYVLDKVPAGLPAGAALHATLSVPMPDASPLYATRRMAYATQPHQVGYFTESEWALPPTQLIRPLLVETLRRSGRFDDVDAAAALPRGEFILRSELVEFTQDFTSQPAVFRLRMRFALERADSHRVAATRELSAIEPLRENTARAGAMAANDAVEQLLRELAAFAADSAARAPP
jgi:cholesterol transport system auxiliary component